MISNPKPGQRVQCWYKNRSMPHHGKAGTVVIASRGKPRNHGVRVDGGAVVVVIPAGNLRVPK